MYSLYLYFLGLSLRNTSKALVIFRDEKRSYVSIWNWIQRFGSCQIYKRKRVSAFIIDETVIQIGNQHFWLWICIEPIHSSVLGIYISEERNICLLLKNLSDLLYQTMENILYIHRWRYMVWWSMWSNWIKTLSTFFNREKLMERVNQYLKDRIESFDDYYPCMQKKRNAIYFMYITGYNSLYLYV